MKFFWWVGCVKLHYYTFEFEELIAWRNGFDVFRPATILLMKKVRFLPLAKDDLDELLQWHTDNELSRRYAGAEWPLKLWEIIQRDNQRRCWIAWNEKERIGYVDWEMHPDEQVAWIGLAVKPERRGEGLGAAILRAFLLTEDAQAYADIRAGIEPDNTASVRCFSSAGFMPITNEPDEEGIVDYVYKRR